MRDTRGLAEIRLVSPGAYDRLLLRITDDQLSGEKITLKIAEGRARVLLSQRRPNVMNSRKRGELLPFKDSYY